MENIKSFTTWKDYCILHGPEVEKGRINFTLIYDRLGLSRRALQFIINRQRFETQKHDLCATRTLAKIAYEYGLNIDQRLSISPDFVYFNK